MVKQGLKYLDELGLRGAVRLGRTNPKIIDPKTIDWKAVADGKIEVLHPAECPARTIRWGGSSSCSPTRPASICTTIRERELFKEAARLYSGGCVRLEDAWRLSRWLFGRDLDWEGAGTEEPVPLAAARSGLHHLSDGHARGWHVDRLF